MPAASDPRLPPQRLIAQLDQIPGVPVPVDSNPMARSLGAVLQQHDAANGQLVVSFEPDDAFVQGAGLLQGGIVSAMLDFAMAFGAFGAVPAGHSVSTASLQVSFLRPAPQGRYTATAQIERCGRTLVFTRAQLNDHHGRAVATGASTLAVAAPGNAQISRS